MSFHLLLFTLDAIGFFVVLIIGARVLAASPSNGNAQLLACLCVSSACARLLARLDYGYFFPEAYRLPLESLEGPLHLARNLSPGIFMVICWRLFRDRVKFPRVLLGLWILQFSFETAALQFHNNDGTRQYQFVEVTPALLQLVFSACGLFWIIRGWDQDLVEKRRRLRWMFLFVVGGYVFTSVLFERLLISWYGPFIFPVHANLSVFGVLLACVALFAMLGADLQTYFDPFRIEGKSAQEVVLQSAVQDRDEADLQRLLHAFREERVYQDGKLSVASLATRLKIPEYRLRRLIHERLGYRNFNSFLHDYRIADAVAVLSDPAQRSVPILTIALTLGYNSINPFNRAFREAKGMAPSEFRAQALNGVDA